MLPTWADTPPPGEPLQVRRGRGERGRGERREGEGREREGRGKGEGR